MGSPPALILANFFVGCYEKYRIEKIEVVKPTFCKRYATYSLKLCKQIQFQFHRRNQTAQHIW